MALTLEPTTLDGIRRSTKPEARRDSQWVSPEAFFRSIQYVTLKVTNGCNLKCSYCNVEADVPSTPRMSIELFKHIADVFLSNTAAPSVGLEFHGGEPLLLSEEWYEEAVGYAGALAKKYGKTITHPMQTNGTRLTEERLDHLRKLGICVGISIDGPPHINDRHRMAGKRVEQAVKMLVARRKNFGIILVLSHSNCREMPEIMEYFRTLGVPGFRINFMQPQGYGMDHALLSGTEMFEGVKAAFDHMVATDCSVVEAEVQTAVNRFVMGRLAKPRLSCWELECQAGRTYVAVNHMGDVFSCGTDMMHHRLGHVVDGFSRENMSSTLCSLHHKDPWYARCFTCSARRICNQSCPTSDANNIGYRDADCEHTRLLYSYFLENEDKVRKVFDLIGANSPAGHMMR